MASVYDLKPKFQNLLRPLCGGLARWGVTANQVTLAAAVLSIAEGTAILLTQGARWTLLLLPLLLFIRMALNAIDGMLAREFDQKSRLGAILNELGDVVSDSALYLPFAVIPGVNAALVVAVVVLAIFTEMTGVVAVQIGATRRYDGPFGKSDRALAFGVLAVALATGSVASLPVTAYLGVMIFCACLTIYKRARSALREIVA
ncbi:MAG: CDP-alcohol phosphatidyltransferase family protein [Rhizomicrobium sp.]|nr:CDP-alcohol phosphatidyltransferase family protein [Rhizomicrobium sp.]